MTPDPASPLLWYALAGLFLLLLAVVAIASHWPVDSGGEDPHL